MIDLYRRFATVSAIAASAVPSLLFARGHRISQAPEIPLVISSAAFTDSRLTKTSNALKLLSAVGAGLDVDKVKKSKKLRAGKGKLRNRRHKQRRGPLVIFNPEEDGKELNRVFRNVPGVESCNVYALNLLQLAPGGHLGRFIVWTSSAFAALDKIYGSTTNPSPLKKDFLLPAPIMKQPDVARLINSSEVQSVLRPVKGGKVTKRSMTLKKNPLRNRQVLLRLNPYAKAFREKGEGHLKVKGNEAPERAGDAYLENLNEN